MSIGFKKAGIQRRRSFNIFNVSRWSLYQAMTLLEIFKREKWISEKSFSELEQRGKEIASMLERLINSISNEKS